jgi:hypothetical protein
MLNITTCFARLPFFLDSHNSDATHPTEPVKYEERNKDPQNLMCLRSIIVTYRVI